MWQHLKRRDEPFYAALGRRCYLIGPERDEGMLEGLDLARVRDVAAAEFILNTGPWGWDETTAGYEPVLQAARARDLPMVCANADLVVVHRGRRVICAGALAERYEALGGRVRWHGKPFPSVYADLPRPPRHHRPRGAFSPSATVCAPTSPARAAPASTASGSSAASTARSWASRPARARSTRASPRRWSASGEVPLAVAAGLRW